MNNICSRKIIRLALVCAFTFVTLAHITAQEKKYKITKPSVVYVSLLEKQYEDIDELLSFLKTSDELRNYAEYGFTSVFSGVFRPIPDELQKELRSAFPEQRFYIAKMRVLIDPPYKDFDLILITNNLTGQVEGYIWADYWIISPSDSFGKILKSYQAKSKNEAVSQVKTFAKLITFASNDKVGNAKVQNGKVKVELIRGEGVFGILEAKLTKNLQFDRLNITEPDGKKLRYFVSKN